MTRKVRLIFLVLILATLLVELVKSTPLDNLKENGLENILKNLQADFELKLDHLMAQLKEERTLRQNLGERVVEQGQEIHALNEKIVSMEAICSRSFVADHSANFVDKRIKSSVQGSDSSPRAIYPGSCADLARYGHTSDGIYLVGNQAIQKIEAHFCNFDGTSNPKDDYLGTVGMRSSVHFYVQRDTPLTKTNEVVTFKDTTSTINIGNAMNLAEGIFTAPVAGIYHFEFHGVRQKGSAEELDITLETELGDGLGFNKVGATVSTNSQGTLIDYVTLSLSATLELEQGNMVRLFKGPSGVMFDSDLHTTHFTGYLVEEPVTIK